MSDYVFIEQEPAQGTERPLEPGTTIGREGCDITITDPDVSRRHAAIQIMAGELSIEDLGSTNGTFVNGEQIMERRTLRGGDEVRIGSTVWRLRAPAEATRLSDVPSEVSAASQATTLRPAAAPEPATEEAPSAPPTEEAPPAREPVREEAPSPAPEPVRQEAPAAPQPSERAPAPSEPAPARSERAPAPSEPAPARSERAPAPISAASAAAPPAAASRRGDVPLPDFAPSAIRRIVPADAPTAFTPETQGGRRGSAATRGGATLFTMLVVALTTAGVVLYYVTEPFK
jgi:predicted component of type VI protein secretion system